MFTRHKAVVFVIAVVILACTSGATSITDDFEDGSINTSLWNTGGWRFGIGGLGSGGYSWSNTEVVATDGYLDVNIQGPQSGFTYGAYAYVQSVYNYNDGDNHLINFNWGADVNANHIDFYGIQISPGIVPINEMEWMAFSSNTHASPNPNSLYFSNGSPFDLGWHERGQQDLAPTSWSVTINSQTNSASLYAGTDATGALINTINLDPSTSWYFDFITADATSGGYAGSDNHLFLYSYQSVSSPVPGSSPVPEPATVAILGVGIVGLGARRFRKQ